MRMRSAATAAVVIAGACGSSAAAPIGSTRSSAMVPCGPRGATTLAADSRARIYRVGSRVYGCARGARQAHLLGHDPQTHPGQARIGVMALAGVDAAYSVTRMGVDTASAEVVVRRLDNGRTLHSVSATTQPLGPEFFQAVEAIVVKPDGAVAWIGTGGSIVRQGHETEVDRLDRRGEATLDTGSGIDAHSLRLHGAGLSWRDGGTSRSATLL